MRKHCLFFTIIICVLFVNSICFSGTLKKEKLPVEARAVWVTRWDYKSPEDIAAIMDNLERHNFNMAIFQVRGNATTFYPSEYEPWAFELTGDDPSTLGKDPGWDPLATAVKEAHMRGIELHAWLNTYPAWRGEIPPPLAEQLWNKHPEWFTVKRGGVRHKLTSHYVSLAPTIPAVREYLLKIYLEVVKKYDVDGIHYDFVRFTGSNVSYDPISLDQYKMETGLAPEDDNEKWSDWRRESVTRLLRKIYRSATEMKPDLKVTAAVWGDYDSGRSEFLQDSHRWLAEGILDAACIMGYSNDIDLFTKQTKNHLANDHDRHIYPGIGRMTAESVLTEVYLCRKLGAEGNSIFAYRFLFPGHEPNALAGLLIENMYQTRARIPEMPWKSGMDDDVTGPLVTDVVVEPRNLKAGDSFNVTARITDPSGVYYPDPEHEQAVHVRYTIGGDPADGIRVPMLRSKTDSSLYKTARPIMAEAPDMNINLKIYAYDDDYGVRGKRDRTAGYSEMISVPVSYKTADFEFEGNLVSAGTCQYLEVDSRGMIWTCNWNDNVVQVYKPDGTEAGFSPITKCIIGNKVTDIPSPQGMAIPVVCGLSYDKDRDLMYVSMDLGIEPHGSTKGYIAVYRAETAEPVKTMPLFFRPGDSDVDAAGNLFVADLRTLSWHVFDADGNEWPGSPVVSRNNQDRQISRGIAVNADGTRVYIPSQTRHAVFVWRGDLDGGAANYRQTSNLARGKTPTAVDIAPDGKIYVSDTDNHRIQVFDVDDNRIGDIAGGEPYTAAPRGVGFSPDGEYVYVNPRNAHTDNPIQIWKVVPE